MPDLLALRPSRSPAQRYRARVTSTQALRRLSQFAFFALILSASVTHNLSAAEGATASLDALCPFGGVETLWRWLTSGGQFVAKTHLSNLVLALGLLIGALAAGGAFCGWVCPFGFVQDGLAWARARLRLPELRLPARLDRVLRFGRYLGLALVLYQTISAVKLWFADYDPYRALFGLGWLFEFNLAEHWPAYAITGAVLAGSFFVERAWCRYLCPLGGLISLLGNFSLLRIRRDAENCKACAVCERPCPVKLNVATARTVSSDCIGCLACVQACPRRRTLEVQLAPAWLPAPKPRLDHTLAGD